MIVHTVPLPPSLSLIHTHTKVRKKTLKGNPKKISHTKKTQNPKKKTVYTQKTTSQAYKDNKKPKKEKRRKNKYDFFNKFKKKRKKS